MIEVNLTSKTALVTGASQGLGQAIATRLHAAGANVVLNYFGDPAGANQANAERIVQELRSGACALKADVRSHAQAAQLVIDAKEKFGGLNIVVNNAGILRDRSIKKMTVTEWQEVIDTNLTGVFNVSQAAAETINEGGRIVNMASVAAELGFFGQANYAAAKAGVIAFTKVLSKEVARRQITANAVAPGVVLTDMGKAIPAENRKAMLEQIPLGRFCEPQEIADVVLFLASDLASYITGQTLHVNGGWWG